MKASIKIILVIILLNQSPLFGQFQKGVSFINASLGYRNTFEKSKDIGFDRHSYGFLINCGYGYFLKKNHAISVGLGYSNGVNRVEYSTMGSLPNLFQNSNRIEGMLAYTLINKKKSNFFISHQLSINYSSENSHSQFIRASSSSSYDGKTSILSLNISPLILNYQISKRFFISSSSFLNLSAVFRKYRETDRSTNQSNVTTRNDYQFQFWPTVNSITISYFFSLNN
jgi:hypothetical protein